VKPKALRKRYSRQEEPIVQLIDAEITGGATPEDIINGMIIPALRRVGDLYEQRVYYLPQLIYSAEAGKRHSGIWRSSLPPPPLRSKKRS
jgi:methanogenic corrinoid protein MtbC1